MDPRDAPGKRITAGLSPPREGRFKTAGVAGFAARGFKGPLGEWGLDVAGRARR